MGSTKKAVYKVHNGTDFDIIHFETEARQVKTEGGSDVETQLAAKANKIQENWISPTLLNGTINQEVNNFNLASYRKNNFGIVNLKGVIQVTGTSTTIFILPVGYRPDRIYYFPVMCAGPTLGQMTVKATGEVIFIGGVFSYIDLSTINFEAVQ